MLAHPTSTSSIFVYGTLCQGGCRQTAWPLQPESISTGWTHGTLYSRHDYPALLPGTDRVRGECWQFQSEQMPTVLKTLDRIEGTNQSGFDNLYDRKLIEAFIVTADEPKARQTSLQCHAYFYARDPLVDGFKRLSPDQQGFVRWPATSTANQSRH